MEWYDLISFRSKRCAYTYMCRHVCMTCFRITTLSKHVGISSAPKTWCTTSSFASNQKTECNICQNTPVWLKTYEQHKKTTFCSFFMPWFSKKITRLPQHMPQFIWLFFHSANPFRNPNHRVSKFASWRMSLLEVRASVWRRNPPSKTWDLSLRVRLVARGKHPGRLTWNLKMMVWKMIFLFNWVVFRFHVNLPWGKNTLDVSDVSSQ